MTYQLVQRIRALKKEIAALEASLSSQRGELERLQAERQEELRREKIFNLQPDRLAILREIVVAGKKRCSDYRFSDVQPLFKLGLVSSEIETSGGRRRKTYRVWVATKEGIEAEKALRNGDDAMQSMEGREVAVTREKMIQERATLRKRIKALKASAGSSAELAEAEARLSFLAPLTSTDRRLLERASRNDGYMNVFSWGNDNEFSRANVLTRRGLLTHYCSTNAMKCHTFILTKLGLDRFLEEPR